MTGRCCTTTASAYGVMLLHYLNLLSDNQSRSTDDGQNVTTMLPPNRHASKLSDPSADEEMSADGASNIQQRYVKCSNKQSFKCLRGIFS